MSLSHGILGFLNYGKMSSYDLAKVFNESVQFFWHAQNSHIYLALDKLEKKGFATHERIIQNGKPNKKLYSITDAGRKEFIRWLADGSENTTNDFKSAFLMKVFFSGNITPVQSLTILKNFAADCRLFLDSMHTIPGSIKQYSREVSPYEALHWQFTADFGYSYVRMCMEWAERCMHQLEEFL